MEKSILVVEDESKIREFISLYLRKEGYKVIEAYNGEVALKKFSEHKIDLIVLDVMMPKLNGFEVCKKIREKSKIPIIILTAIEEERDHVKGYELGADDYVTKPFKVKILIAKIKRLLERIREENDKKVFIYEKLKIDIDGREVFVNGRKIKLAPKEFELLEYLVFNENKEVLNDTFFKDFNYITIRNHDEKEFRISLDFLIDEEGNFRNRYNEINVGEQIEVIGMGIKGTNFIEPLEIKTTNTSFTSDEGYSTWDELYKKNHVILLK